MEVRDGDDLLKGINEIARNPLHLAGSDIENEMSIVGPQTSYGSSVQPDNDAASDGKKIQCPICKTSFGRRDHMRRHIRTVHPADQPAICQFCGDVCKWDALVKHLRNKHPNENRYHCTECRYGTDSLTGLEIHTKLHLSTVQFVCKDCDAKFTRQDHLNRHRKSLHSNEVVTCSVCKQSFKRKDHMLRHMRGKHTFSDVMKCMGRKKE